MLYNYQKILTFFNFEKLETIKKNINEITDNIQNSNTNSFLGTIKNINKDSYKNIKKRLKLINKIISEIDNKKEITKGEYEIIKQEEKNILNLITILPETVSKEKYLLMIKEHIENNMERLLKYRKNNINWFEENTNVESFDNNINYNYEIY